MYITSHIGSKLHYLVDGGPTKYPGGRGKVVFFQNLLETFLKYAFKSDGSDTFKADGIMVTHPDSDHIEGVVKLFQEFPPNQDPQHGKPKFEFKGPLLLTKAFEETNYSKYITIIKNANFERKDIKDGDLIDGFEEHFTFSYPEDKFTGILYKYEQPSPHTLLYARALAATYYSPTSLHPNPSSTLLVISDPNPVIKNPLVSLNGDALGHSILQSLNGTYPKIFKVPHHGSRHNNIALTRYVPKNLRLTQKLLATLALLQIAKNDYSFHNEQITSEMISKFDSFFDGKELKRKREIKFKDAIKSLSTRFNEELKKQKEDTSSLLEALEDVLNVIKNNLNNPKVESVDLYTNEIKHQDRLTKFEAVYNKVEEAVYNGLDEDTEFAYEKIFAMLQTDYVFSSKIAFRLIRSFYSKINAQVYFISSGSLHNHPHWEVVNGIIAAAHDQHKKDPNYKCCLLLTSGNNINGEMLDDLATTLKDDWSKYVTLQYFAIDTASVEIDSSKVDPTAIFPGALKWKKPLSLDDRNELLNGYNQTKGAQALKRARAAFSGKYEINPFQDKSSWLSLQDDPKATDFSRFEMSSSKTIIRVESKEVIFDRKNGNIVTKFEFSQSNITNYVTIFALLDIHTPTSNIKTYTLYMSIEKQKMYMLATKDHKISSTENEDEATHFCFTAVPLPKTSVPIAKHFLTLSAANYDQPDGIKQASRFDTIEVPVLPLEEFFQLIQYHKSTISCKELLDIVVSQQFISQFLNDHSDFVMRNFLLVILDFTVDKTSTFSVQNSDVVSANIKLIMPSKQFNLQDYIINEVEWIISDAKTTKQKVSLEFEGSDNGIPITLTYHLKSEGFVQNFQKYLTSLGITKNSITFNMFDAMIFLLQSQSAAFVYLSSLSRKMVGILLEWGINEEASSVAFVDFPTGPVVTSADIIAKIPDDGATIDLGLSSVLMLTKVGFTLPNQLDSSEPTYLFANATIGDVELQIVAYAPEEGTLPKLKVSLVKPLTLKDIVSLLSISKDISNFTVPLTSKVLGDIQITEAGFTYQQGVKNSDQTYLQSVHFGIKFTNLNKYLPAPFSNLKTLSSHAVIYQPTLSFVQLALEIDFEFSAVISKDKTISLAASFATEPVTAGSDTMSSYNYTVSVEAKSDFVGTTEGSIPLVNFLEIFGLAEALSTVRQLPFLDSILSNIQLKQLVLALNTSNKSINTFILELMIFDWVIIPEKVVVDNAYITLSYIDREWATRFHTTIIFDKVYSVDAQVELPSGNQQAKFKLINPNLDFTISNFLDVFGLGSTDSIPVIGQFLNIAVNEATLQASTKSDGNVIFSEGMVSLYAESIKIGSLFELAQVNATVGFILDPTQDTYVFGFSVGGFINNQIYLDVEYDHNTSVLSGQVLISSFSEVDLTETLAALNNEGKETMSNNPVFSKISKAFSADMAIAVKYASNNFKLTDLVITLNDVLSVGSLSLQKLRFEYHDTSDGDIQSQNVYKLVGELTSKTTSIGAILEFDLTENSTGQNVVKATLSPTSGSSLTLRSLLSILSIVPPPLPEIEGQELPKFFDIVLTRGIIILSLPSFNIVGFRIEVSTNNEVVILDSPVIKLGNISLFINYDENGTPTTKALLRGNFSIGDFHLTLEGSKEEKGTVFTIITDLDPDAVDIQQSINKLTPKDTTSPTIPSDIGIPKNFKVFATQLRIELYYVTNERSLLFTGSSNLDWLINLGFQQFFVKQLGGKIFYHKSFTKNISEFQVDIIGQFQLKESMLLTSKLHFGANSETILSILGKDTSETTAASITDDVLGFSHPTEPNNDGVTFQSLLPNTAQSMEFSNFFININFTQAIFLFSGGLVSIGQGFLIAGKFSSESTQYGYIFGISLSQDFKFSNLLSALSPIDDILTIQTANCIVVSVENVKVEDVITKLKAAERSVVTPESNSNTSYPFSNLNLDSFTNDQELVPGLSIYGEIDFQTTQLGSLFNSIIQISNGAENVPNIIVSCLIGKDPTLSEFKAYIAKLTLLGAIQFSDIVFSYKPANKALFELTGTLTITVGEKNYDFKGNFVCNNEHSEFTVSTGHEMAISEPLGMVGITLESAKLMMEYNYPKEMPHTSSQAISAIVKFYSTKISSSSPTPPSIVLECSIIFDNYTPTIVMISLKPDVPLTIADLIMTIFGWQFDIGQYLNIGFVNGEVYYAKLETGTNSVSINGITYKNGYHISADIKIFDKMFTIEADILSGESKQVTLKGFALSPLDLGFAKFTGVDDNDNSKPDESKSPEVLFVTNSNSTSISLAAGFVLFEYPLGTAKLGYQGKPGKSFIGQLTYHGKIGFIKNPSIDFEWSQKDGFKVTNWPVIGSFEESGGFDFFSALRNYKDDCGALVDLAFKKGVQTQFNCNIKLSKAKNPKEFLAEIHITGTYEVLLLGKTKISSIPLPDLSVGIPREKEFTLQKLPNFILDLFAKNSERIIQQLTKDPKKLAKILAISALKKVSKQIIQTLACRNVDTTDIDPEDISENDFNEAESSESEFNEASESFDSALEAGELTAAGEAAATAETAGVAAIGIFSGIIAGFTSILSFFGIGSEKKRKAEEKKKETEQKLNKIKQKLTVALDIKQSPSAIFTPPDKLVASWNPVKDKGAKYHVKVVGILLSPETQGNVGQLNPHSVILYEDIISETHLSLQKIDFYDTITITLSVNGTLVVNKEHKYDGKIYTIDVQNVHPTLHPPTNINIIYHHASFKIFTTANKVEHGENYHFELVDSKNKVLTQCIVTPNSISNEICCEFLHSAIERSTKIVKVRGQATAKSGSNIASSVFGYSNQLTVVDQIRNLQLVLPHFSNPNQILDIIWDLPISTEGIHGYSCQVVEQNSKKIVLSKEVPQSSETAPLPTTCSFKVNDITAALVKFGLPLPPPNDALQLIIQVSASSNSDQIIDSVFIDKLVTSLPSPQSVICNFSADTNTLEVSWMYVQETQKYGLQISNLSSEILFSKLVEVTILPEGKSGKAGTIVRLDALNRINDPSIQYTVQVTSVADGNDEMDSLAFGKAASSLQVLEAPLINNLQYVIENDSEFVALSFTAVKSASKYLAGLLSKKKPVTSTSLITSDKQSTINIDVDNFIDKLASGDVISGSVQALGSGYLLSSTKATLAELLKVLPQPATVEYSYAPMQETITLTYSPAQVKISTYALGFIDGSQDGDSSNIFKVVKINPSGELSAAFSANSLRDSGIKLWKGFAQSTLTDTSNTQLPSPHLFLKHNVVILPTPVFKSMQFNSDFTVLHITISSIDNAHNYQVNCIIYGLNDTVLKNISKIFQPSNDDVSMEVDFNSEIAEWKSLFSKVKSLSITITAGGSGYYITSKPSESESIKQQSPPNKPKYSYSNTDDTITITYPGQETEINKVILGLTDAKLNGKRISEMAEEADKFTITITGQKVRDFYENECYVFAQSLGGGTSLPSSVVTLADPVNILRVPEIKAAHYDEITSTLTINWSVVENAKAYYVVISYRIDDKINTILKKETTSTNLILDMNKVIKNWDGIFGSVSSIVITTVAMGQGLFINSNKNHLEMHRTAPPTDYDFITVTDADLTVGWNDLSSAVQYDITSNGDYGVLNKSVKNKYCTLQKRFLLYPTASMAHQKMAEISITAKNPGGLPSSSINKHISIQSQRIEDSKIFGINSGEAFDDANGQSLVIVGMQSLVIHHESSINSLHATYFLANGSIYTAPSHGGQSGQQTVLRFDKYESIIAISAMSSSVTNLSQLIIVTQNADGDYKRYGPYGEAIPKDPWERIKHSGNVLSIKGRCNNNSINAIGFKFTYTNPVILYSKLFGGNGGSPFDEHTLTHVPTRVVGIKGMKIQYRYDHILTIQSTYLLQDGKTWEAPTHGIIEGTTENLQFEDGETIIEVSGNTYFDMNLVKPKTIVKQLSFRTQNKAGVTKSYGPYGGGQQDSPMFTLTGAILGLFGRSGWFLDSVGVYYSLQRTELFGGSGGGAFDVENITNIVGIKALKIWSSSRFTSIEVTYLTTAGKTLNALKHGLYTDNGRLNSIEFEEGEEIVQMEIGTYPEYPFLKRKETVGKLKIVTQKNNGSRKVYGPYGNNSAKEYTLKGRVIAFFGRSGWYLDAIGMYYIPCCS